MLNRERRDWQCEAATLFGDELLARVMVEMVEPDLAHDKEVDPQDVPSAEEIGARFGAHMLDFVDYRGDLPRARPVGAH